MMLIYLIFACEANKDDSSASDHYATIQVNESGQITCLDVVDRSLTPFNQAITLPFDESLSNWDHSPIQNWIGAEGVMIADWTGDSLPDIYVPTMGHDALFIQQPNGTFHDEASTRIMSDTSGYSIGGISADFNGDHKLDIALLSYLSPFQLLINTDDGYFELSETDIGYPENVYSPAIAVGDPDYDLDLDIVIGSIGVIPEEGFPYDSPGTYLFTNNSDGFSSQMLEYVGLAPQTFFASFLDLDDDLDQDLYLINDHGPEVQPSQIYLSNPTASQPLELTDLSPLNFAGDGMGLGVGDINNDGYIDMLATDYGRNHLFLSDGRLSWYDAADVAGIQPVPGLQTVAWGAELIDINHDGLLDIWIAYGQSLYQKNDEVIDPLDYRYQPDELFIQLEGGHFESKAAMWGLDREAVSRGGIWNDIDRNGFLDFISIAQDEEPLIHMATCDESRWINIELKDEAPNTQAIGAIIEVTSSTKTQRQWVLAGGTSYASSGLTERHFGLSNDEVVDVRIIWPDGRISLLNQISTNQFIKVIRE